MVRRINWFDSTTEKQREKKQARYENKMFPLGPKQKEKEISLLKELIPDMPPQESLYYLLEFKEIVRSDEPEEDYADWKKTNLAKKISKDNQDLIYKLALASLEWKSLDDIPNALNIKEKLKI